MGARLLSSLSRTPQQQLPDAKKLRISKGSSPGRSAPPAVERDPAVPDSSSDEARLATGKAASPQAVPAASSQTRAAEKVSQPAASSQPAAPDSPTDEVLQAMSPTESPDLPGPVSQAAPVIPRLSLPRLAFNASGGLAMPAGAQPAAALFGGSHGFQKMPEIHPAPPRWSLQASQQAATKPPLLSASVDAPGQLGRISSAVRPPAVGPFAKALKQGSVFPQGPLLATLQPAPTAAAQEVRWMLTRALCAPQLASLPDACLPGTLGIV